MCVFAIAQGASMKHKVHAAYAPVPGAPARHAAIALRLNFPSLVRRYLAFGRGPLTFRKDRLPLQLRTGAALSGSFALLLLTFGSSAEAGPIFTACVVAPEDSLPVCVSEPQPITMRTGSVDVSLQGIRTFRGAGSFLVTTAAESTPLGLKAHAGISLIAGGTQGRFNGGGSGYAAVLYDDFLVNASGASFIPGSLNLFLSGSVTSSVATNATGGLTANGFASAGVTVGMTLNGTYVEGGATESRSSSEVSYSTYGPLTDLMFPALFRTPVLNLPVGTPFSLLLELMPGAGAAGIIGGTAQEDQDPFAFFILTSFSNFASTLTFPTSGPVFNLPDGATVNSASGLIVNNRFVGGSPAGVPEPGSLALLAIALGAFAFSRRRKTT